MEVFPTEDHTSTGRGLVLAIPNGLSAGTHVQLTRSLRSVNNVLSLVFSQEEYRLTSLCVGFPPMNCEGF